MAGNLQPQVSATRLDRDRADSRSKARGRFILGKRLRDGVIAREQFPQFLRESCDEFRRIFGAAFAVSGGEAPRREQNRFEHGLYVLR